MPLCIQGNYISKLTLAVVLNVSNTKYEEQILFCYIFFYISPNLPMTFMSKLGLDFFIKYYDK